MNRATVLDIGSLMENLESTWKPVPDRANAAGGLVLWRAHRSIARALSEA